MSTRTRLLGVDFGTVRVGLAVTDPQRIIASPLLTYERRALEHDATFFRQVVQREEIGALVVGLPIHNDGRVGAKAREALQFGAWLSTTTALPVYYFDERFTTAEAETHLRGAQLPHAKRKEKRDRVAAQVLLQAYLEAGCPAGYEPSAL